MKTRIYAAPAVKGLKGLCRVTSTCRPVGSKVSFATVTIIILQHGDIVFLFAELRTK